MCYSCTQGNGLSSTYGSSGAGHGGSGGVGSNQKRVGIPFGNLYEPRHFGCHGGGASGVGLGGGIIKMTVSNKLKLDGSITCSGSSGTAAASGGGSGGSLWIETNLIQGSNLFMILVGHFCKSRLCNLQEITLNCTTAHFLTAIQLQFGIDLFCMF